MEFPLPKVAVANFGRFFCSVYGTDFLFVIGINHGFKNPYSINDFLDDFIVKTGTRTVTPKSPCTRHKTLWNKFSKFFVGRKTSWGRKTPTTGRKNPGDGRKHHWKIHHKTTDSTSQLKKKLITKCLYTRPITVYGRPRWTDDRPHLWDDRPLVVDTRTQHKFNNKS
jgi:hypothetical protein